VSPPSPKRRAEREQKTGEQKMKNVKIVTLAFVFLLAFSLFTLQFANADPTAGHIHASSAWSGGGSVGNPGYAAGEADSNYASLTTTYQYDTAIIIAEMAEWSIGEIWVKCSNYAGSQSGIIVYASTSSDGGWIHVGNIRVTSSTQQWLEITDITEPGFGAPPGYAAQPFKYVALCCISPTNEDNNYVYVDAIAAEYTHTVTFYAYDDMNTYPYVGVRIGTEEGLASPGGISLHAGPGTNYFYVQETEDYGYYYYTFEYMTIDGVPYYTVPGTLDVYSDKTINVYYSFHWWY